jgi:hypothetical protein
MTVVRLSGSLVIALSRMDEGVAGTVKSAQGRLREFRKRLHSREKMMV